MEYFSTTLAAQNGISRYSAVPWWPCFFAKGGSKSLFISACCPQSSCHLEAKLWMTNCKADRKTCKVDI